jgi:hypothetical protein
MIRVTSTGEDAYSPHCSWTKTCQYDDASKGKCANALCKAKGYPSGSFVDSSNNFCDVSFTYDPVFVYLVDTDRIEQLNQGAEARITADCVAGSCPDRCVTCQAGPCTRWCSSSNWCGDSVFHKETDCSMCKYEG